MFHQFDEFSNFNFVLGYWNLDWARPKCLKNGLGLKWRQTLPNPEEQQHRQHHRARRTKDQTKTKRATKVKEEMADPKPRRLKGHKATATCCIASAATPGLIATSGEVWLWGNFKFENSIFCGVCMFLGNWVSGIEMEKSKLCRMAAFAGSICDAKMRLISWRLERNPFHPYVSGQVKCLTKF